ncbi:MAG: 50S ribosomal protein L6 [Alphaproteobacteria bacterium]|nr:50S ribosomal protein L6 [Alphaproteobacteria bacterium]
MSRVGQKPVTLPSGVTADIKGQAVAVKGKLGTLNINVDSNVEVKLVDGKVVLTPRNDSRQTRMIWATSRNLLASMVEGVSNGFKTVLEIEGVGFKAAVQGKDLILNIGFSHEVRFPIPEGIAIKAEKPTLLSITGIDKQRVGQVAAVIRGYKRPEPYKGKGIRYQGEKIQRKEGKKK